MVHDYAIYPPSTSACSLKTGSCSMNRINNVLQRNTRNTPGWFSTSVLCKKEAPNSWFSALCTVFPYQEGCISVPFLGPSKAKGSSTAVLEPLEQYRIHNTSSSSWEDSEPCGLAICQPCSVATTSTEAKWLKVFDRQRQD